MSDSGITGSDNSSYNGTRKLVRPRMPEGWDRRSGGGDRRRPMDMDEPLTNATNAEHHAVEASHAEAFYFQKQIQYQTDMTVVMDDGDQVTGVIEWYDKGVLKLRSGRRRVLIYKSAIKYLYKTAEQTSAQMTRSALSAD